MSSSDHDDSSDFARGGSADGELDAPLLPSSPRRPVQARSAWMVGTGLSLLLFVTALGLRARECAAPDSPGDASAWTEAGSGSGAAVAEASTGSADTVAEASAAPAEASAAPQLYVVQEGDSLWLIGDRFGCPFTRIMEANGLTRELIRPGQELIIPSCEAPVAPTVVASGETYVIEPGDFLETIAARTGCSVSELMTANNLIDDSIYAGDTLQIPVCAGTGGQGSGAPGPDAVPEGTYVIQGGDTLGGIALRHGCAVSEIMLANNMASDFIRAGDPLVIPTNCTGTPVEVRTTSVTRAPSVRGGGDLASLMRERGFRAPSGFKALVVEIAFNADRSQIVSQRAFDYAGTGDDLNWNAASTVKIYSAVAALQYAESLGFTHNATVTFHGRRGDHTFTLAELIEEALVASDNIAHNFLVTFTGHDRLNTRFFSSRNGFQSSAIRRAYETSRWMNMGEAASLRNSPRITIREGSRTEEIEARQGTASPNCDGAACTTPEDLNECMRRLMLQEQLPEREGFGLSAAGLRFIRQKLAADRSRGQEVVDQLAAALDRPGVVFFHKAGFAGEWYSDNVYIYDPSQTRAWVVTLAGHPGRSSLNNAARIVGEILAANEL